MRIKTDAGIRPFELFDWQADFAELVLDNPRVPISLLSSRQTGKSVVLLTLMVYLAMSREQFSGVLIHRKMEDARQLARRIKNLIPHGTKLIGDSLSLIQFAESGSILHFRSANHSTIDGAEGVGRGLESVDVAIIEESSHTANVKDICGVIGPAMTHSAMASIIQVGTSGRKDSYYYECLTECFGNGEALESKLSGVRDGSIPPYYVQRSDKRIAVVTNWRAIDKFDKEGVDKDTGRPIYLIRIQKEQDLSDAQISAEHELIFGADETTAVFDFKLVQSAKQGDWEEPQPDAVYWAGVDGSGKPKAGRKGDYTACVVLRELDDGTFKVVKHYRRRGISFEVRYAEISDILNKYQPFGTYVEGHDSLGQTFTEALMSGCPGLDVARFIANRQRKAAAINKLQLALERKEITIPKSPIITELLSFQQFEDGQMGSVGKDAHDDLVDALCMALSRSGYPNHKLS